MMQMPSVSNSRAKRIAICVGLLGLFSLAATGQLAAAVHLVPFEYATIQAAVDAAAPGDSVLVAPGVYPEAVSITGKYVYLFGAASDSVTIDGLGLNAPCITIDGPSGGQTVVRGFTLYRADCANGALFITDSAAALVDDCCVAYNRATASERGPVSVINGAFAEIRACRIVGNIGAPCGGVTGNGATLVLEANLIIGNAPAGFYAHGGCYVRNCITELRHNTILNNHETLFGYLPLSAVHTRGGSSITMVDNVVAFNIGIGLVLRDSIDFVVESNDVFANSAGDYAALLWSADPGASPTNISVDPDLVAPEYLPQAGSPVVGAASDGGNMGLDSAAAACSPYAVAPVCGNGILELGEECDDGNLDSLDGCSGFCFKECPIVLSGDVNLSGDITAADVIYLVNYVFKGGLVPQPCKAAGDVNCSGTVTSADVIGVLNYIFNNAIPPCDGCTSPLAKSCDWPG